jgi:hypothetical protein
MDSVPALYVFFAVKFSVLDFGLRPGNPRIGEVGRSDSFFRNSVPNLAQSTPQIPQLATYSMRFGLFLLNICTVATEVSNQLNRF